MLLNYKSYLQASIMGLVSGCSLLLSLYLSKIFDSNNFNEYSYFIFIIPILQAILSFNSISLISIKILSGITSHKIVNFFISLSILCSFTIIVIIFFITNFNMISIPNRVLCILFVILAFVLTLNDIHHQTLIAKELSVLSYVFYFSEKIFLIVYSLLLNGIDKLDFLSFLMGYIFVTISLFIVRIYFFRIGHYSINNLFDFFINRNRVISAKYLIISIILFLLSYISSNIDRFISSVFLNGEILALYTKIFLILSGSNMLAQSLIIANLKNIYGHFREISGLSEKIRQQSRHFFLIALTSSIAIFFAFCAYDLITKENLDYKLLIIFMCCAPAYWITISNKPFGLYIDFCEIINIKFIASLASIFISILIYFLFKNNNINLYIPSIILFLSSYTYAKIIKIYVLNYIKKF